MSEHPSDRSGLFRLRVLTAAALVVFAATLTEVTLSPWFVAYGVVLAVVTILLTWNRTGTWYIFWWAALPSGTLPGAVRRFYDDASILSLEGVHIIALLVAIYGTVILLFRLPQRRGKLLTTLKAADT